MTLTNLQALYALTSSLIYNNVPTITMSAFHTLIRRAGLIPSLALFDVLNINVLENGRVEVISIDRGAEYIINRKEFLDPDTMVTHARQVITRQLAR